jgi:Zn-dependent protease
LAKIVDGQRPDCSEDELLQRTRQLDRPQNVTMTTSKSKKLWARILSALVIVVGALKAATFVIYDYARAFAVNPFEGFGATQYAVAGGSMLVSVIAYMTKIPGPRKLAFAIGLVGVILVHETGHAIVMRMKGLRAGMLVFIPFVGGAVTTKNLDQPRTVYDDAMIGLAGPVTGTLGALLSLQIYKWNGDDLWLAIAGAGFLINLFNMLPIGALDGGRISAAITKWMWVIGGGILIYQAVKRPNPLMVVILVLAAFQVYASIMREKDDKKFYEISGAQRAFVAFAYFALVFFLGHQTFMTATRLGMIQQ